MHNENTKRSARFFKFGGQYSPLVGAVKRKVFQLNGEGGLSRGSCTAEPRGAQRLVEI